MNETLHHYNIIAEVRQHYLLSETCCRLLGAPDGKTIRVKNRIKCLQFNNNYVDEGINYHNIIANLGYVVQKRKSRWNRTTACQITLSIVTAAIFL